MKPAEVEVESPVVQKQPDEGKSSTASSAKPRITEPFKVTKPKLIKSKAIKKDPVNDSLNLTYDYKCPFCPKEF